MRTVRNFFGKACVAGLVTIGALAHAANKSPQTVKQADDGSIKLGAGEVQIQGPNGRLEGGDVKGIMWWTSVDTSLRWMSSIQKPGKYRVELNYAIIGSNNGSPLAIMVGDQIVKAVPKAGSGFNDYKTGNAGEVDITKPGELSVMVRPLEKAHEYVINIRSINILPADTPTEAIDISGNAIKQSGDGSFKLTAGDADINGMNAQLETDGEKNIGFWKDVDTSVIWLINVRKLGTYRVEMEYSLMDNYEGSKVAVSIGDQTLKARPKSTKEWTNYTIGKVGEVTISKEGDLPVVVNPISKPWGFVFNLRSITLLPAETPTQAIDVSDQPITQAADGSFKLAATDAEVDGEVARIEGGEEKYLAWWNSRERFIKWPIRVNKPGRFRVSIAYSLAKSSYSRQVEVTKDGENFTTELETVTSDTSEVELGVDGQSLAVTLKAGSGWDDYKTETLGEIAINKPGELGVVLKSSKALGALVLHLRSVSFEPIIEE